MKKRKDGRYQRGKTINGKLIFFYSNAKTERAAAKDIEEQIMQYAHKEKKKTLFSSVADEWWEGAEQELAYQSQKSYRPAIKRACSVLGNRPVEEISVQEIESLLRNMHREGFAYKTISNQRVVINMIMDHALRTGKINSNVCLSARIPKGAKKAKRSTASKEDEKTILMNQEEWLFPFIALMTGMRKGEILALQWKDIDFEKDLIHVYKSVYHKGDKPFIKEPKTEAGTRIVPLLTPLKKRLLSISPRLNNNYIISDDGKIPLTNRRFITLSTQYREKTGISCTAHQLRHSFATIAFESDASPKAVQEMLGHQQLSTTMDLYTEFREKALRRAAELLNKNFDKNI